MYALMFITYRMAECCEEKGEYQEALAYYENALRVLEIYAVKEGWYGFCENFTACVRELKEKME